MNYSNKGFSLIEVIVVVVIIGILTAVAIPSYQEYVKETNVGIIESNLYKIKRSYIQCLSQGDYSDCNTADKLELSIHKGIIRPPNIARPIFFNNNDSTAIKQCFRVELANNFGGCISFTNGKQDAISEKANILANISGRCGSGSCSP